MKAFFAGVPAATGCVALGMIGLGTLLSPWHQGFLYLFGGISVFFVLLMLCKLALPGALKMIVSDPSQLSVLAGTAMAMMLISAQLRLALDVKWAGYIWYAALAMHLTVMVLFTVKYALRCRTLGNIHGSWLLVYAGISVAAIGAPAFNAQGLARIMLVIGGLGTVGLLPVVYMRYIKYPKLPAAAAPLFCITAAPVPLWLSGCLKSLPQIPPVLALVVALASIALYIPALLRCIKLIGKGFAPSFAAFTFPFVINATALSFTGKLFQDAPLIYPALNTLRLLESVIALCLCLAVAAMYLRHLFSGKKEKA